MGTLGKMEVDRLMSVRITTKEVLIKHQTLNINIFSMINVSQDFSVTSHLEKKILRLIYHLNANASGHE